MIAKRGRCLLLLLLMLAAGAPVFAGDPAVRDSVSATASELELPRVYRSPHFVLHTDLDRLAAEAALARLDQTVEFAADYWKRQPRGQIDCYLINDLASWPDAALPHRLARVYIGGVGGATIATRVGPMRTSRRQATVFAAARPGIAEHEAVHAYCFQTFGTAGPTWYREGMAELAAYTRPSQAGLQAPPEFIQRLQARPMPTVAQIISGGCMAGQINNSLDAMLALPKNQDTAVPMADWTLQDSRNVAQARDQYAWCWALCYMMASNPNYADRFRSLGQSFLRDENHCFHRLFGPMARELEFEYRWFVEHAANGLRLDLCCWDWHKRWQTLPRWRSLRRRIDARRGYQPTGLLVTAGQRYQYRAEGSWSTAPGRQSDADGNAQGTGRLVGRIMHDWQLSEPIELGASGSFRPQCSGRLYVRCRDDWTQLDDNSGNVLLELTHN